MLLDKMVMIKYKDFEMKYYCFFMHIFFLKKKNSFRGATLTPNSKIRVNCVDIYVHM